MDNKYIFDEIVRYSSLKICEINKLHDRLKAFEIKIQPEENKFFKDNEMRMKFIEYKLLSVGKEFLILIELINAFINDDDFPVTF